MKYKSLIFVVLFCTSIIDFQTALAQAGSQDINISPDSISIHLTKSPFGELKTNKPSVTLNVHTLKPNISVIDVYSDTFFEEKDRWPPINSKLLDFTITDTELGDLKRSEIEVIFNLPSDMRPSSYKSNIHVTASSGSQLNIPLNLIVSASEWVIGFWILLGVILNLSLFMIKDIIDERNKLRETLNSTEVKITNAYNAICKAIRERRLENLGPASKYILAHTEFTKLIGEWNKAVKENSLKGAFAYIGKKGDRVVELADGSDKVEDEIETVEEQFLRPPTVYHTRKPPEERLKYGQVRDYIWRSKTLQYLSLMLTFAIIVLNSWQTYLMDATVFGASGLSDIFAAILFGFGSQTVLTQGVGLAKSWAESSQAE